MTYGLVRLSDEAEKMRSLRLKMSRVLTRLKEHPCDTTQHTDVSQGPITYQQ